MINIKKKCLFVHIPKTGGNSVDVALTVRRHKEYLRRGAPFHLSPSHITAVQIRRLIKPELWNTCFKFAFIRNPWDQRVSQFFHQKKGLGEGGRRASIARTSKGFKHFLMNWGLDITTMQRTQMDYIVDKQGKVIIDFVGRFENFEEDFKYVCKEAGYKPRPLPHHNKTKHKHYTEYYTDETREIVAKKFRKDIAYGNYEFGK